MVGDVSDAVDNATEKITGVVESAKLWHLLSEYNMLVFCAPRKLPNNVSGSNHFFCGASSSRIFFFAERKEQMWNF